MDLGIIRGTGTLVLMLSFVALCVWAWAPAQRRRFEAASMLPFLDDDLSPELKAGRQQPDGIETTPARGRVRA